VGAAPELQRGDRCAVPGVAGDGLDVAAGAAGVAVGVDADDVEGRPVDVLPEPGGIGQLAAEPRASRRAGPGEEGEGGVLGLVVAQRGEPDLQAEPEGVPGRQLEPVEVPAADPHGVAVQVVRDHLELAPDLSVVEVPARPPAGDDLRAGVVVDAVQHP
jgi:hypothetical protein